MDKIKRFLAWAKQAHAIDKLTTWAGTIAAIVQAIIVAGNVDATKLLNLDMAEWGKFKLAAATWMAGWLLNKRVGSAAAPKA